ncbi:MAG TPA: methylenetetrahydrofolate--tRNA-(uracil(54)-C(5))-methyltransferase (FADH(2)-oxidizing) TrmFO [Syntrophales bacterium]|nr:methylenetetrahydrofolate--tRNA-(uracil(54)-C(5))-methyltransferase (FADH(2)-oxidizing) TrmFO [Syntrophales bacterium]HOL59747.1 methylenetetrahydrofolate--tRNA-(uracil(54)-C(5))-methyltransferase (FADH(2)-oxidizing) TrmFO [Syntrophales bacterium]HPO35893.1 methylenetetrahydrofolate--tRNA-(uracil(54)-C(5))-methyltransferase (FADH(2)-oxidizing) TrmFO [Syntrophales bacterium]
MTFSASAIIIGGGLAGCEAAWQLARRGFHVQLYEMKPLRFSAAHKSPGLAELVCSNSLRSSFISSAAGLLKEEMRHLDSLIMYAADKTAIPAGRALAVDRVKFSQLVEEKLMSLTPFFHLMRQEVASLPPERPTIIATGPLTADALAVELRKLTSSEYLYFYDAISPVIYAESIDYTKAFWASRYGEGADYLNLPMNEAQYLTFWQALLSADTLPAHTFEDVRYFEGCLPIEVMAKRGKDTLRFGPMKPVGLTEPRNGIKPYAVVQLRKENTEGTLLNMVGFQTRLRWPEQEKVFRLIPGLEKAEFARYGSIHRNTFVNSPALLNPALELRDHAGLFLAGQITGVEGYIESAAMGLLAGLAVACYLRKKEFLPPPPTTAIGALLTHITTAPKKDFQPMNVNFGLFPPLAKRLPIRERGHEYAKRALHDLRMWKENILKVLED